MTSPVLIPVFKTVADRDRAFSRPVVYDLCVVGGRLMEFTRAGTWAPVRGEGAA